MEMSLADLFIAISKIKVMFFFTTILAYIVGFIFWHYFLRTSYGESFLSLLDNFDEWFKNTKFYSALVRYTNRFLDWLTDVID